MNNNEYKKLLEELHDATLAHKTIFESQEKGLASWHQACQKTWERLQTAMKAVQNENEKTSGNTP